MTQPLPPLRAGDILFCRDWTPISWWIRKEQGDFDYSHVCLVGEAGTCLYSTGAHRWLWFGKITNIPRYLNHKKIAIGRYPGLTDTQIQTMLTWCHQQVGVNAYPAWKVTLLALKGYLGRMIHHVTQENPANTRHTYCAESVALAFSTAGITLTPKNQLAPNAYTPESLWNDPMLAIIYQD